MGGIFYELIKQQSVELLKIMKSFMFTLLKHTALAGTVPMSSSSPLQKNHKSGISFYLSLYISQFEAAGF